MTRLVSYKKRPQRAFSLCPSLYLDLCLSPMREHRENVSTSQKGSPHKESESTSTLVLDYPACRIVTEILVIQVVLGKLVNHL